MLVISAASDMGIHREERCLSSSEQKGKYKKRKCQKPDIPFKLCFPQQESFPQGPNCFTDQLQLPQAGDQYFETETFEGPLL